MRLLVSLSMGYLWALFFVHGVLSQQLPAELEGKDIEIIGIVDSLPQKESRRTQFNFQVNEVWFDGRAHASPGRISLNWYNDAPTLKLGQQWQLTVRLKQARGFANPGGFDYEKWLFSEKIRAQGYVRDKAKNTLLNDRTWQASLYSVRQSIADIIENNAKALPHHAILSALSIGDRQAMSAEQWQVLLATGTNHLMAISGLHIGLVAGLFYFVGRWCWSRSAKLIYMLPAPQAAAYFAILGALYYSFLAGFSIPTQRALIMVVVVMLGHIQLKQRNPSHVLAIALLAVLIWDPLSALAASFWLSFIAVLLLVYTMCGRVNFKSLWWTWGRAQWVLFIGLLPCVLFLFQKASLVAPIANLIAVPWVSFIVVPLCLLGVTMSLLSESIGLFILQLSDVSFAIIWSLLRSLSELSWAQWSTSILPLWISLCACIGGALLLAPRGFPLRWLGVVWFLPLWAFSPAQPKEGELWITMLDVGQGLSVVLQTKDYLMVYDTGPKYSDSFDTGRSVVVPFIKQHLGKSVIDTLVIGHGDNDHIGGAESVMLALDVNEVLTSVPKQLAAHNPIYCQAGMSWTWNSVNFEVIHPQHNFDGSDNDTSCVVRAETSTSSILIAGDIERRAERTLLRSQRNKLASDILIVPHHGSLTSSTPQFIDEVSPKFALFAVGYRNQYGFPKPQVVARYAQRGIKMFDSVRDGAISIQLNNEKLEINPKTFRSTNRYYWHGKDNGVLK